MRLTIHPDNPQQRHIEQAADVIRQGGVIAYPTDSAYALGCHLGDKDALERIRRIRQVDKNHFMTLICKDLSEIATYARVDNWVFRLLKHNTPGPYTFILKASGEVPKRILHAKRKSIGLRIPDNQIVHALLNTLGEPILSSTLTLPGETEPLSDPDSILESLEHSLDLVIDGGCTGIEPTSVINMSEGVIDILRTGKGDLSPFS